MFSNIQAALNSTWQEHKPQITYAFANATESLITNSERVIGEVTNSTLDFSNRNLIPAATAFKNKICENPGKSLALGVASVSLYSAYQNIKEMGRPTIKTTIRESNNGEYAYGGGKIDFSSPYGDNEINFSSQWIESLVVMETEDNKFTSVSTSISPKSTCEKAVLLGKAIGKVAVAACVLIIGTEVDSREL